MQIDDSKRPRAALKTYFAKNAIPTADQFAQLIDSTLNQRDDGFVKNPADPLSIEAVGDDLGYKKAVNFYLSFADADPAWSISLRPRSIPAVPLSATPAWSVIDAAGNARLAINADTGNVGIGTVTPHDPLEVTGRVRAGAMTIGPWPANPTGYVFVGSNLLDQTQAGNYALLQGTGLEAGTTYLNSPAHLNIRINNSDRLVVDTDVSVAASLNLASSDVYFTETAHAHTGRGNVVGHAAIENDGGGYQALMILGRSVAGNPLRRVVKLWDYLQVNGTLDVTGDLNYNGTLNQLNVRDNFVAQVGCADFRIGHSSRRKSVGRALVDSTDTLVVNFGPDWPKTFIDGQTTIAHLASGSSRALKDNIAPLSSDAAAKVIDGLDPVSFTWKRDGYGDSIGFIAEDSPAEVVTAERDAIYYANIVAALTRCVKDQGAAIAALSTRLTAATA